MATDPFSLEHSDKEEEEELIGLGKQRGAAPSPTSRPLSALETMMMYLTQVVGDQAKSEADMAKGQRQRWLRRQKLSFKG